MVIYSHGLEIFDRSTMEAQRTPLATAETLTQGQAPTHLPADDCKCFEGILWILDWPTVGRVAQTIGEPSASFINIRLRLHTSSTHNWLYFRAQPAGDNGTLDQAQGQDIW